MAAAVVIGCLKIASHFEKGSLLVIITLPKQGWSFRRIGGELGIHREAVSRYVKLAAEEAKPAKVTAGNWTTRSKCEPLCEVIIEKLDRGLG